MNQQRKQQEKAMKHEQKIPFMAKVKDKVSGLEGKVTAFVVYMHGCAQYEVKYLNKDKDDVCSVWWDEERLEVVSVAAEPPKATEPKAAPTGGPSRGPHRRHTPPSR